MSNSLIMALGIALGKIAISITAAYAIVYFRFPGRELCFVLIFITLMMPVEVRIVPTFQVAANLNFIDSYAGLILPLIASATAFAPRYEPPMPMQTITSARDRNASATSSMRAITSSTSLPTKRAATAGRASTR